MIDETLLFLKNCLNAHLNSGRHPDESPEDQQVVFLDGNNMDPPAFKLGAISVLLINIEEENTLRAPDQYERVSSNGTRQKVNPEIRLNLYVLFVARYSLYQDSLHYLSLIIQYFQNHRVLTHQNAPEMSENIEQLILELITLPFSEQNEIWNALRTTYHPSVLYKVKMVVFQDKDAADMPQAKEIILKATT